MKLSKLAGAGAALALCASAPAAAGPVHGSTRTLGAATLSVRDFVVPRGRTLVVERRLDVRATGLIEVEGSIEVDPGAALSLSADRIVVDGRIVPAPQARLPLSATGRPTKMPVQIEPLKGRKSIVINGMLESGPSQSIVVYVSSIGTITVNGTVKTDDGIAAADPQQIGGNAGDIIMTAGPIDKAAAITISEDAVLHAGDGGAGYSDTGADETESGNPCGPAGGRNALTLTGTRGGDGGSIRLLGEKIADEGTIEVGNGGNGGNAGDGTHAPSGGADQGGVDFKAHSGNGGNGGAIETPGNTLEDTIHAGTGGNGGKIDGAAGDGGPNCDGGSTAVSLGDVGHNGTSGKEPETQPHVGALALEKGGRGGAAADAKHPGGDGGSVLIREPSNHLAGPVDLLAYADGGHGFDACGNASTNATAGGDGGGLTVTGQQRRSADVSNSFDGGDGGDGHPPGLGGERGSASAVIKRAVDSFQAGDSGLPCGVKHKKKGGTVVSITTTTTSSTAATTTTASTSGTTGAGAAATYTCSGKQITLFDNTNGNPVGNGGAPPTFGTGGKAYCVTYIQTYHWNNGAGAPPGTLGLKSSGGSGALPATIGPFAAKASAGQNNAPNVNWYVYVPESPAHVIDGSYTCTDSGVATWSSNSSSGGAGFCIVYAVPAIKS